MPGTLFIVATPIGNLEDFTFRGLRTLKEVDVIAAEDTRRTSKLLAHYDVRKPLVSLHEHNEVRETPRLIARLERGESIALVSDAGTPGIADPGATLVRAAHQHGIAVVPIPGPSAVAAALSASGFSGDEFVFLGFPPRSGTARTAWFERAGSDSRVLVFFESPHRISRTMDELSQYLVNRQIAVCREITKINETLAIRPIVNGSNGLPELGEYVLVVGPGVQQGHGVIDEVTLANMFGRLTELAGISETEAAKMTGHAFSVEESVVRKAVKRHRIALNRAREARS